MLLRHILLCYPSGSLLHLGKQAKNACICGNYWNVLSVIHELVCREDLPVYVPPSVIEFMKHARQHTLQWTQRLRYWTIMFQVLSPCGLGDFVCGRASEWVSNGTELCHASGFSLMSSDDSEEALCYGGKGSVDYTANLWKTSPSEGSNGKQDAWLLEDLRQWISDMPFNERVSWAVGGMVLTAGLLFLRSEQLSSALQGNWEQKQISHLLLDKIYQHQSSNPLAMTLECRPSFLSQSSFGAVVWYAMELSCTCN
ncbi:hypothetical protein OROMI_033453 [Orobanche minor]